MAPQPRSEPVDAFVELDLAARRLIEEPPAEPVEPDPPPHLWQKLVDRFEFAACPEDSRSAQWAQWFSDRPDYMERVMTRARPWLPDIAAEIEQRQLPGELALLPILESAYDPFAYSHGRAAGAWQFVSATAREYGIEINDYYDGRRDVWAATRAALDYLETLHARFEDWNLALAAYNGGQGRVARALARNHRRGQSTHWSDLRLPRETLGYVPKLNGLGCLFANAADYDFEIPQWDDQPQVARLRLDGPVDVVALATTADLDLAELVALNPGLNHHLTPPGGPHHLFVPHAHANATRAALAQLDSDDMVVWEEITVRSGDTLSHIARRHDISVQALKKTNDLESDWLRAGQSLRVAAGGILPEDSPHGEHYRQLADLQQRLLPTRRFQHQVRPGENLWLIARRYRVTVNDIRHWNNLGEQTLIRPGQQLRIDMEQPGAGRPVRYTVRRGDSLWLIARRHDVSIDQLLRLNGLSENSVLRPGQTLTIRRDNA